MTDTDLIMFEATATYFERAASDMRARRDGRRPEFGVLPLSPAYADGTAKLMREAIAELRRLRTESMGNG